MRHESLTLTVIPGLTRNPVFMNWIPAPRLKHTGTSFAGMTDRIFGINVNKRWTRYTRPPQEGVGRRSYPDGRQGSAGKRRNIAEHPQKHPVVQSQQGRTAQDGPTKTDLHFWLGIITA